MYEDEYAQELAQVLADIRKRSVISEIQKRMAEAKEAKLQSRSSGKGSPSALELLMADRELSAMLSDNNVAKNGQDSRPVSYSSY